MEFGVCPTGNVKKERSYFMELENPSQSIIRGGYVGSICFIFANAISLIRVIFFSGSPDYPITPPILSKHGIIHSLPMLLLIVCMGWAAIIGIGNLGEYGRLSRDIRKGWGLMCGVHALSLFVGLFSAMDGILGIFTYIISFSCSFYAFLIFRQCLKETALAKL